MRDPIDKELMALEKQLNKPMAQYLTRSPRPEETQRLINRLQPEFDALKSKRENSFEWLADRKRNPPSLIRQCMVQLKTYTKTFWLASCMVFVMLTLTSASGPQDVYGSLDLYSLIVPLLVAAGMLYGFKSWNPEMRMVESVTPFPPALLLLSRFLIIVAINILLGLAGTAYLGLTVSSLRFFPFLINWLSLVLFVGGIMAYVMFWKGLKAGMALAVIAWLLVNASHDWMSQYGFVSDQAVLIVRCALLLAGLLLFAAAYRKSVTLQFAAEGERV